MQKTHSKDELIELERQYWQAIQEGNKQAALRLTADPCVVAGAQGCASFDRATFSRMMEAENWKLHRFEIQEPIVQFLRDDVAIVAYRVHEELTLEGEPLSLDAAESSTWIRQEGTWRCALHTESLIGDSFGRDRIKKNAESQSDSVLGNQDVVANLGVKDLNRARKFYEGTVGLTPVHEEAGEAVVYQSGNSTLNVYRSAYAGTNQATAVTWQVADVDATVKALRKKGVSFEHYDMPETRLEGDVHVSGDMRLAWFKDPDGNILNVMNQ